MGAPSGELIATIRAAVDLLADLDVGDLDGRDAAGQLVELEVLAGRMTVLAALRLPVVEADGWWATGGARSLKSWLAAAGRMTYSRASTLVQLGRALRADLPATAEAAMRGRVPLDHAVSIAKQATTTSTRREALAAPADQCGEQFLVEHATQLAADTFNRLVRRWSAAADPDSDDRGYRKATDRQFLTLATTTHGMFVRGFLTTENGAALHTALDAVMSPPAPDDTRTTPQRRGQALADLARITLDHGLVGTAAAARPQISCVVDYDTLQRALTRTHTDDAQFGPAQTDSGKLSPPGGPDDVAHRESRRDDPTAPARPPGRRPPVDLPRERRLQPVADIERFAIAEITPIGPVPNHVLARLACDSEISRIVFGPTSQVIDAGRAERTFAGPRRRAIIARDHTCRYPGCSAPPALGEIHHIDHWACDHGHSNTNRGILLCWHHHALIHRHDIDITPTPTGGWTFHTRKGAPVQAAA